MRLAFVSVEDPEDVHFWSGTPHFALEALRAKGIEVELIAPLDRRARYLLAPLKLASRLRNHSIQYGRHPVVLGSYARQIEKRLRRSSSEAVLAMDTIPISRLRTGLPVVTWVDAVFESMEGYYSGAFRACSPREVAVAHRQEEAALNRASYAIYSSDWAAGTARKHYKVPEQKIQVVRFGANLSGRHSEEDVRHWIDFRLQRQCRLLFMGVDWERKGGPIALRTVEILRERGIPAQLVVVGCGSPNSPFIENHGFISKSTIDGQQRLRKLFAEATLFLLPTRAEAAGIVFCEASAFGLPSLATATGGVESYVRNGFNGYCLPHEATEKDFADRIQSVLNDVELYRRLSMNAYREFSTELNWDTATSRVIELLEKSITAAI